MKLIKFYAPLFLLISICSNVSAQETKVKLPEFLKFTHSVWVDSLMKSLTPEERIAQLIMVAAYSNKEDGHRKEILKLIKDQKIGGLIFFQGGPVRQVKLMNEYQEASKVPLLGAIDAEWGIGMRLDSTVSYPFQMTLGAIQNDSLIHKMGAEVARQIKRVGLHLNFAPVVDVNNNAANPVINYRSFGENKIKVAEKGIAYMLGLQENGVLPTAKHFPGHGNTDTDSHYALPQITHSRARLDETELYPFREIIKAGIGGVMVAHLDIPALDSTGVPSTLSKPIISGLLKEELGFQGLIVTDAMNMKGVTKDNSPGIVDKDAILAGNDLLEFTEDVPKAILEIKKAIKKGLIPQKEIDARCRKLLALKQWAGLSTYQPTPLKNIIGELNTPTADLLNRNLTEASLTVLKNKGGLLPLKNLESLKIANISVGKEKKTTFQESLELYTEIHHFNISNTQDPKVLDSLKIEFEAYNLLIIGIHDDSKYPRNNLKISTEIQSFLKTLSEEKNSILTYFKNPYSLENLEFTENTKAIILTYQDSDNSEDLAAQLIFGGVGANGKLPVSVGNKFKEGDGLEVEGGIRFKYTLPEDAGMDSELLNRKIDSLMQQAMELKAIPGGQILVAKDQKVVFHKAYGFQSYSDTTKVKLDDLYDLASVTKISSALPALMKLKDEGKFDLNAGIDTYLPYFRNSNKAGVPFRQILAHQARFKAWIPYWKTMSRKNGTYKWKTIKRDSSARFPMKISENMWLYKDYKKEILKQIKKSELENEQKYLYSGLAFYLLPDIVANIAQEDFQHYIGDSFYKPLGASTLTYNPLARFSISRIAPTENDYFFRKTEIHGTVHDEGAILMNGVSSNAGLFASANDLAKLMQLYLNKGIYGGERFILEETVEEFTKYQFLENGNRRGLGFDKPSLGERIINGNTAISASDASYGHTGYTGPMVWMDPEKGLLYVFLANRVLPTRENTLLYKLNTRTKIQQVLYDSLKKLDFATSSLKSRFE
ncbi:beta-glucosidase-like glycosyl hydrolase [Gillisia sp. Hel_I_86]|uniref:glycoside hydrolase family 3 N-terminal domain-containing protein n=1 Tax=Gillisia sp. Hel_I_86 TaxID=1249981 RepID=UPI00119A7D44|nr:glycoside hydrolase family 3 N-terminal domain-containing protein [Gillisia sp. Hel_I_86]TVZ26510.1 beta-glucosidase-like glycosyl hydrolase [Gillisia sp. Hel_I_86]